MPGPRLFISYSRQDSALLGELVRQVRAAEKALEIECWYDRDEHHGIVGGDEWKALLRERIDWADVFCLLLTANWATSKPCADELAWAQERGKPVVQIRARATALPVPKASCVPNSSQWIDEEAQPGRRDRLWQEVVTELARVRRPAVRAAAAHPVFDRLCRTVETLHAFKQFHDIAHDLQESHCKPALLELQEGRLRPRTRAECRVGVRSAHAEYTGLREDRAALLTARDEQQIAAILECLEQCRGALVAEATEGAGVADAMLELASHLGRSLTYFNDRMLDAARAFDAQRFAEALTQVLAAQSAQRAEWERWLRALDSSHALLDEHDLLQRVQDELAKFEPEDLDSRRARDQFQDAWREVAGRLGPVVERWHEAGGDGPTRTRRQAVGERYRALCNRLVPGAPVDDPDWLAGLKRELGDFQYAFDDYFLRFDKLLREEYRRLCVAVGGSAAALRGSDGRALA